MQPLFGGIKHNPKGENRGGRVAPIELNRTRGKIPKIVNKK
jgi:hypothetical protein